MHDDDLHVTIDGFYDGVSRLTDDERALIGKLPFDESAWLANARSTAPRGETGYSTLERVWARPTAEVNGMWGGYQGEGHKTIVPAEAHAKVSFRLAPGQDPGDIQAKFEAWLAVRCPTGVEWSVHWFGPGVRPCLTPLDHPALGVGRRAMVAAFGTEVLYTREGGSGPEADLQDVLEAPVVSWASASPTTAGTPRTRRSRSRSCSRAPRRRAAVGRPGPHPPGPTHPSNAEPLPDLALSRAVVDRAAHHRTDEEWLARTWARRRHRCPAGRRHARWPCEAARSTWTPLSTLAPEHRYFLGVDRDDRPWFAADLDAAGAPDDGSDFPHAARGRCPARRRDAGLVVHAVSLANWHAAHTHCPRCGKPTDPGERRPHPALPRRPQRALPAHRPAVSCWWSTTTTGCCSAARRPGQERFSTLAGFVEPGESLEAAVRREVVEEGGVRIGEVTYLASQPWPFPSSLMLGFTRTPRRPTSSGTTARSPRPVVRPGVDARRHRRGRAAGVAVHLDLARSHRALVRRAAARARQSVGPMSPRLDALGWAGSAQLVYSLLQARVLSFRVLNTVGCVVLIVFNALVGVWPMVGMNLVLAGINVWFIRKLLRDRHDLSAYAVLEVGLRETPTSSPPCGSTVRTSGFFPDLDRPALGPGGVPGRPRRRDSCQVVWSATPGGGVCAGGGSGLRDARGSATSRPGIRLPAQRPLPGPRVPSDRYACGDGGAVPAGWASGGPATVFASTSTSSGLTADPAGVGLSSTLCPSTSPRRRTPTSWAGTPSRWRSIPDVRRSARPGRPAADPG